MVLGGTQLLGFAVEALERPSGQGHLFGREESRYDRPALLVELADLLRRQHHLIDPAHTSIPEVTL